MKNSILLLTCLLSYFHIHAQDTCSTVKRCIGESAVFSIEIVAENYAWQSSTDSIVWVNLTTVDSVYTALANATATYYRVTADNDSSLCWLLESVSIALSASSVELCAGDSSLLSTETSQCEACEINWTLDNVELENNDSIYMFYSNSSIADTQQNIITVSIAYEDTLGYSCVTSASESLIVNPLPNFSLVVSNACLNQPTSVSVVSEISNVDYSWNNGASNLPNFTPSSDIAGEFTLSLQLTNNSGCSSSDTTSYSIYALPSGTISGETTACPGESISLSVSSIETSFSWTIEGLTATGSEELFTFTSTESGIFEAQLVISDPNNCASILTQSVEYYTIPDVSIEGADSICFDETITLTAVSSNSSDLTYLWSDNSENSNTNFQGTEAGEFLLSVSATSAQGCSSIAQATIFVNELPQFSITGDNSPCGNTTFELFADNASLSYEWFLNNNISISTSDSLVYEGTYDQIAFYVTGIDTITQCQNTQEITGQAIAGPLSSLPAVSEFCEDQNALISDESGFEITWQINGNEIEPDTFVGPVLNFLLEVGSYNVFATIRDTSENCTSYDTLNVIIHANPVFVMNNTSITCENQPIEFLISDVAVGGSITPNYTVNWINNNGFLSDENPFIENSASAGNYLISAVVTESAHNCSATDTLEVTVTTGPSFVHPRASETCFGENVLLTIDSVNTADYSVLWTFPESTTEGNSATLALNDSITTYTVSLSNNVTGCITDSTYYVEALPLPSAFEISLLTNGLLAIETDNNNGLTWGYTSAATGIEIIIGATDNYAYFENFDPANNYYWAEYANTNGCVLRVYFNQPLNIETPSADAFVVYPIPVSDQLNIESDSFRQSSTFAFSIMGSLGQVLEQGIAQSNQNRITLDISKLSAGQYYIVLHTHATHLCFAFTK